MNRVFLIIAGVVLLAIAIASVLVLLLRQNGEVPPSTMTETPGVQAPGGAGSGFAGDTADPAPPAPPVKPAREVAIANTARMFAELYGSYSTELPFENLRVALPYMTERFRKESERTLAAPRKPSPEFYQVLTRAQSAEITKDAGGRVVVLVGVSREEEKGKAAPKTIAAKLELTLVAEGDAWKVDKAAWR